MQLSEGGQLPARRTRIGLIQPEHLVRFYIVSRNRKLEKIYCCTEIVALVPSLHLSRSVQTLWLI